ncbi:MAG: TonB-dependent receptor, partial [Woeseia sp.]
GQGSQAGTLRIITNKPNLEEFQSSYDLGVDTVKSGDTGYTLEGMLNIPIHDKAAVRRVGWHEYTGGYIDNVPGTITYAASGITVDNSALVEKDFNDVETTGARALLKIDLNDNWTFTPGLMYQQQESHGLWAHDPEDSGDLEVVRFFPDDQDEDWLQAMSTIEGNVLDDRLNIVYAVSTLDRNVDSLYDYTGYAEYLEDVYAYYGYACYQYAALGGCADPSQYVDGKERFTRLSHELRVQSNGDGAFRWVAGLFSQKQVHDFDLQWIVPELDPAISVIQNGHTVWQTKQVRTDRDEAIFGEVSFDVTDKMSLTLGGRHFKYDNRLYGYNGGVFWCTGFYDANGRFVLDDNGTPQYPCFDTRILDDSTKGSGNSWKGTVNYHINDDVMVYATYSEGFRAGGVNRARLEQLPKYRPDWVNNHEFGWKTTLLDGRMRFNGAAYLLDWKDFQYSFLDFALSPLTVIGNVGKAQTTGFEFDVSWLATDTTNLSFAGSFNKAELEEGYWRTSEDRDDGEPPRAPVGTEMPFVPELQLTAIGRQDFDYGSYPGYAQIAMSYTGATWNNLEVASRMKQKAYTLVNLSTGIQTDTWSLDLFINNATDERAQISLYESSYPSALDSRTVTNRPRSIGIRFGQKFN